MPRLVHNPPWLGLHHEPTSVLRPRFTASCRLLLHRGAGRHGCLPARVQRWIAPFLRAPVLRPWRIAAVFAVAVTVDAAQLVLGPLGWSVADEVLDLVAMVLTVWLLGFHVLLLPTFLIEVLPVVDMLPTWTGCVGLVVARRRQQAQKTSMRQEVQKYESREPSSGGSGLGS